MTCAPANASLPTSSQAAASAPLRLRPTSGRFLRSVAKGVLGTWDAATGKALSRTAILRPDPHFPASGRFAPGGRLLAAQQDGVTLLYDPGTGKKMGQLAGGPPSAFSPDGPLLAVMGSSTTMVVWDMATGKEHRRLAKPAAPVAGLQFTQDGRRLVIF